jgi:hypothetical protein
VRYLVEVRKAGAVVDCPSGDGVLGQAVRMPLSGGGTVVALAQPRGADGRSRIAIRVEQSPGGPGGLEVAQEIANSLDLAKSSPTFEIRSVPDFHFIVLVESLPLLATTRNEPEWRTHLHKFTPARTRPSGECQSLRSRRGSVL